jgi:hypothetical protein
LSKPRQRGPLAGLFVGYHSMLDVVLVQCLALDTGTIINKQS